MFERLVHWLWDRHGTDRCSRCLDQWRVAQRLRWTERPQPTAGEAVVSAIDFVARAEPVDLTGVRMAVYPGSDPT